MVYFPELYCVQTQVALDSLTDSEAEWLRNRAEKATKAVSMGYRRWGPTPNAELGTHPHYIDFRVTGVAGPVGAHYAAAHSINVGAGESASIVSRETLELDYRFGDEPAGNPDCLIHFLHEFLKGESTRSTVAVTLHVISRKNYLETLARTQGHGYTRLQQLMNTSVRVQVHVTKSQVIPVVLSH